MRFSEISLFASESVIVFPSNPEDNLTVDTLEKVKTEHLNFGVRKGKSGEKYEAIYKDLEEEYKKLPFSVASGTLLRMRQLKQKYFPKPKTKVLELLKELDKEVNQLLGELGV